MSKWFSWRPLVWRSRLMDAETRAVEWCNEYTKKRDEVVKWEHSQKSWKEEIRRLYGMIDHYRGRVSALGHMIAAEADIKWIAVEPSIRILKIEAFDINCMKMHIEARTVALDLAIPKHESAVYSIPEVQERLAYEASRKLSDYLREEIRQQIIRAGDLYGRVA